MVQVKNSIIEFPAKFLKSGVGEYQTGWWKEFDPNSKEALEWAKTVDFIEPIEVNVYNDGSVLFSDGHHRTMAGKILNHNIPVFININKLRPEVWDWYYKLLMKGKTPKEINPEGWNLNHFYDDFKKEMKETIQNHTLKILVEQILEEQFLNEQWSAVTSTHAFGKDRTKLGGDQSPFESSNWNVVQAKELEYEHKLRDLEPVIRRTQQFKLFLRDLGGVNPDDESSLFRLYENFLHYFSIDREEFQDGDDDDKIAARAVVEYFKYHPDRLG